MVVAGAAAAPLWVDPVPFSSLGPNEGPGPVGVLGPAFQFAFWPCCFVCLTSMWPNVQCQPPRSVHARHIGHPLFGDDTYGGGGGAAVSTMAKGRPSQQQQVRETCACLPAHVPAQARFVRILYLNHCSYPASRLASDTLWGSRMCAQRCAVRGGVHARAGAAAMMPLCCAVPCAATSTACVRAGAGAAAAAAAAGPARADAGVRAPRHGQAGRSVIRDPGGLRSRAARAAGPVAPRD